MVVVHGQQAGLEAHLRGVLSLLPAGAAIVQLRDRCAGGRALLALAESLRTLTAELGALLVINDRADVALAAGADGLQLPERGLPVAQARGLVGPRILLGRSIHDPDGARRAATDGADYLVAAPVFEVPGKGEPLGLEGLRTICCASPLPTFALGGVTPERVRGCLDAGAHGVARLRDWQGHLPELAELVSRG